MKKLLLLWIFSGSLDGFSQVDSVKIHDQWLKGYTITPGDGLVAGKLIWNDPQKPDTIRATLIVYHDGEASIVHTKAGFVVFQYDKDEVYLDDKQRVIKYPLEVLTYKLKRRKRNEQ
jgi:hypothetical protein